MEWKKNDKELVIPTMTKKKPKLSEQQETEAFFEAHQCNLEQSEYWAFVYYSGYILRKTIVSQSECDTCQHFMVTTTLGENDHPAYTLINKRDFRPKKVLNRGALTRPTGQAVIMFQIAEANFKKLRDEMEGSKTFAPDLTRRIVKNIEEKIENVPKCHLELVIYRWVRGRIHHYAKFEKNKALAAQSQELSAKERASKTASRKAAVH